MGGMTEHVTLSGKELDRLQIMTRIAERRLTRRHAAELLELTERQVYRLYAVFKARGAAGLASTKRGRPSHRKLPTAVREQALELIRVLHDGGTDVSIIALVNHREESRGGTALHYAVRKRYKEVIKKLAEYGINLNARDQDGLTALDYTQSRGFMPFMAVQTPSYKEEAALLRQLGATDELKRSPDWPVLGPPQGVEVDIWPVGEPVVHDPIYTLIHSSN